MPIDNKNAFVADMNGVVPNAKRPRPAIKRPSEAEMKKQVEKAQNKIAREDRLNYEKAYAADQKERAAARKAVQQNQVRREDTILATSEMVKAPGAELKERLAQIEADNKRNLKNFVHGGSPREVKRQKESVRVIYQSSIADAYGDYAKKIGVDQHEARRARDIQEKAQLEADSLRRKGKIAMMAPSAEKTKLEKTYTRHQWFDRMKKIFRKENVMSHQDAVLTRGDKEFTNIGRAFYGGTKPMYKFEDEKGKTHLYKEAVNCLGMKKPSGALVTEAASKIQHMVCGDAYVPAFAVKSKEGNVLGSMQQMLDKDEKGIDLFSLQDDVAKLGETLKARPDLGKELIREHALDWMLCNFDTKGENFIPLRVPNKDGSTITSIDKEAAFNHLKDPASQNMSYTYKPHSNNTFYNVMFQAYAEGKVDLPMDHMDTMVKKIEGIDNEKYMNCFTAMLDNKYGKDTPERQDAYDSILARKTDIGKQYGAFRKQLNLERTKNMEMGDNVKETNVKINLDQLEQSSGKIKREPPKAPRPERKEPAKNHVASSGARSK